MIQIAKISSLISLGLVIVPCLLFCGAAIGLEAVKWTAFVGTVGWFLTTPVWMLRPIAFDNESS